MKPNDLPNYMRYEFSQAHRLQKYSNPYSQFLRFRQKFAQTLMILKDM